MQLEFLRKNFPISLKQNGSGTLKLATTAHTFMTKTTNVSMKTAWKSTSLIMTILIKNFGFLKACLKRWGITTLMTLAILSFPTGNSWDLLPKREFLKA